MNLSSQETIALAAKICNVQALPHYPTMHGFVPLQPYLGKTYECEIIELESQEALLPCAIGCMLAEKRTMVVTSTPFNVDDIYRVSYMRLPLVVVNFARLPGVMSAHGNSDVFLSYRDAGWLMFSAESNQELLDMVIQAYAVAEKAGLPAVISVDNPSFIEAVNAPADRTAQGIIGNFRSPMKLESKNYMSVGAPVDAGYIEFVQQQVKALESTIKYMAKLEETWKKFKRPAGIVEKYMADDAEYLIITHGMNAATGKAAIGKLRAAGEKVGMLRLRTIRPFPAAELKALQKKHVAVLEYSASSALWKEVKLHCNSPCSDYITMGRMLREKDFADIVKRMKQGKEEKMWV